MISVVIPTFNRAGLLKRTLESVLAQTLRGFEVIVIDDGSTDDTAAIVKGFGQDVRYVYQNNQERAAARNHGIRLARGEYLAFLDSDDLWRPHHLQTMSKAIAASPQAGLYYSSYSVIDEADRMISKSRESLPSGQVFHKLLKENFICNSSVVTNKKCFAAAGFFNEDRHLSGSEDWEMWLRISAKFPIQHVPEFTVQLRHHPLSTTINPESVERSLFQALDYTVAGFSEIGTSQVQQIYGRHLVTIAGIYVFAGKAGIAREKLQQAVKKNPAVLLYPRYWRIMLQSFLGQKITGQIRRLKNRL